MKKLIVLLIVIASVGIYSCRKKDKVETLSPLSEDTSSLSNYEFMDTNEYDEDTGVGIVNVVEDTAENINIKSEDTSGNVRPASPKEVQNADYIYVIVGSYTKLANAKKRTQHFKNLGYDAEILPKFGNYNRVAIAKFNSETEARKKLLEYRKKFNDKTYWLLIR